MLGRDGRPLPVVLPAWTELAAILTVGVAQGLGFLALCWVLDHLVVPLLLAAQP